MAGTVLVIEDDTATATLIRDGWRGGRPPPAGRSRDGRPPHRVHVQRSDARWPAAGDAPRRLLAQAVRGRDAVRRRGALGGVSAPSGRAGAHGSALTSGARGRVTATVGPRPVARSTVMAEEHVARLVRTSVDRYVAVDVLVTNAGINPLAQHPDDVHPDMWNYILTVNLGGLFWGCKHRATAMRDRGQRARQHRQPGVRLGLNRLGRRCGLCRLERRWPNPSAHLC